MRAPVTSIPHSAFRTPQLHGTISLTLRGPDGAIKLRRHVRNIITNAGRQHIIDRLQAAGAAVCDYLAIGTGTNAAAAADTTLQAEAARAQGTLSQPDAHTDRCAYTFPAGTATGAITECGRLNAASNGTLIGRQAFAAINKSANDALEIAYDITYPSASAGGVLFSDDFTGTDGVALPDPWAPMPDGGIGLAYSSNRAVPAAPTPGGAKLTTPSLSDGYAEFDCHGIEGHLLHCRSSGAMDSGYTIQLGLGNMYLLKNAIEQTNTPYTYAEGATLRVEFTAGNIKAYFNGALVIDWTDPSPIASGLIGIALSSPLNSLDNFECGTL